MRPIEALVETAIYADDLELAERFYRDVLGLDLTAREEGRHVFFRVGDRSMLLIFRAESTLKGDHLPAHGCRGPGHIALGIPARILMPGDLTSRAAMCRSSTRSHGPGADIPSTSVIPRAIPSSCSRRGCGGFRRAGS